MALDTTDRIARAIGARDREIERLLTAIKRIDAINDNPACYNAEINKVCDKILRPELKD